MTEKYCVIGKSLPHTLSPEIHGALGRENYGVCELEDVAALRRFVDSRECDGYNVTIPYKREIIPMLDTVSDEAAAIGAVNTVVCEGGKLVGYNTDVGGMRYALSKAGISAAGKNVLILGSGGTCQTAKYLCSKDGAHSVRIVSRTGEINYANCYDLNDTQVIINTTPVGMMPHAYEKPIELGKFDKLEGVFDCIYNPLETMLIKEARERGLKCANGLFMLVEQARLAHNLYQKAKGLPQTDKEQTDKIVDEMIKSRSNLVLTGMAGSGKSVIGKRVAEILGRKFTDTDEEIEMLTGKSIPQIFAESGENFFRQVERDVIERVCSKQGIVIATGGGAVLDDKNVFFMKSNGVCCLIRRDAEKLDITGRPLSDNLDKARTLYEQRKPKYLATADFLVDNDSDIDSAVCEVLKFFRGYSRL